MDTIFNGKFLKQEYRGTLQGQPFSGVHIIGFDPLVNEYQAVWLDSSGTSLLQSRGQYDEQKRAIVLHGHSSSAQFYGARPLRLELGIPEKGSMRVEVFAVEGGTPVKLVEAVHRRIK
jgi:hypothetical protein